MPDTISSEFTGPRQALADSAWQPIKTAPKDGTVVLVTNLSMGPDHPVEAQFGVYHSKWGDYPNHWTVVRDPDPFPAIWRGALVIPTHWMPLPEPPK